MNTLNNGSNMTLDLKFQWETVVGALGHVAGVWIVSETSSVSLTEDWDIQRIFSLS